MNLAFVLLIFSTTIADVVQAAGAASSETAERLLTATGPDPAQLWNPESGAAQEKIDISSGRCMGASRSDGSGTLTQCTGYYYYEGRCTFNSCCQGESDSGYGQHGWCGIGTADSPGGWAYCTGGCNSVPGFDEEDYANTAERVLNIDHRTISDDFKITRGQQSCSIDDRGCASDGEGIFHVGDGYQCDFEIRKAGYLFLTEWDIEITTGSIEVANTDYNGDQYFHNLAVKAGDKIKFRAESCDALFGGCDDSGTGFTICLANTRQQPVVAPPTMAPADFTIISQNPASTCEIDNNGCVTDGPGDYESNTQCVIQVNYIGRLSAVGDFDVEAEKDCKYDYLEFDGQKYCGNNGPNDVQTAQNDRIIWKSDYSVVGTGWTLCLTNCDNIFCDPTYDDGYDETFAG